MRKLASACFDDSACTIAVITTPIAITDQEMHLVTFDTTWLLAFCIPFQNAEARLSSMWLSGALFQPVTGPFMTASLASYFELTE